MEDIVKDIRQQALDNTNFRHVLVTGPHTQAVVMSIPVGGEIGEETHPDNDQVLYLVKGSGQVILNDQPFPYTEGDLVLVKAGTKHNFINDGHEDLKIITTYSPPHHPNGLIHVTKADADAQGN